MKALRRLLRRPSKSRVEGAIAESLIAFANHQLTHREPYDFGQKVRAVAQMTLRSLHHQGKEVRLETLEKRVQEALTR